MGDGSAVNARARPLSKQHSRFKRRECLCRQRNKYLIVLAC